MKKTLEGKVVQVLLGLHPHTLVTSPVQEAQVGFEGMVGDKHAGLMRQSDSRTPFYPRGTMIRNDRQISILSVEDNSDIAAALQLPVIKPDWLGANLLLEGISDLTLLPPSTRLFFPRDCVLYVTGENNPCIHPGKVIQSEYPDRENLQELFVRAALHRRGLVAVVEKPGWIAEGDTVSVMVPDTYRHFTERGF